MEKTKKKLLEKEIGERIKSEEYRNPELVSRTRGLMIFGLSWNKDLKMMFLQEKGRVKMEAVMTESEFEDLLGVRLDLESVIRYKSTGNVSYIAKGDNITNWEEYKDLLKGLDIEVEDPYSSSALYGKSKGEVKRAQVFECQIWMSENGYKKGEIAKILNQCTGSELVAIKHVMLDRRIVGKEREDRFIDMMKFHLFLMEESK